MRAVIQRVSSAKVDVDGKTVGACGQGFLVLLGVMRGDGRAEAELLAKKVANLRVFEDADGKMNLALPDVGGGVLCVSQFTLCADIKKGNRPSFILSEDPDKAAALYEFFCDELRRNGVQSVEQGVFGAHMDVSLVNDGPVTICMDTDIWLARAKEGGV